MSLRTSLNAFAALLAATLLTTQAGAAIITPLLPGPSSDTESASGNLSNRPLDEALNGNGLSSGGTSGNILAETHNVNSGNSGEYWLGSLSGAALTFELPQATEIDALHLWTYARGGEDPRSMSSFDLSFSTNGGSSYDTMISITGVTMGDSSVPIPVQTFSFAAQSGVTHLLIDNIDTHDTAASEDFVGISEIRFGGVIPEPASAALMGLGTLLIAGRRRR